MAEEDAELPVGAGQSPEGQVLQSYIPSSLLHPFELAAHRGVMHS
jgi:hypothetical protein